MEVPMLIDAYKFYSLGFFGSAGPFLILSAPLVGALLSPVVYTATTWRWAR